jgi:Recombination endonuclease VII
MAIVSQPQDSKLSLMLPTEKLCGKCGKVKSKDQFSRNRSKNNKCQHYCKQCMKEYTRQRISLQDNNDKQLWYNYGITRAEYNALSEEQHGLCASCGNEERGMMNGKHKSLAVDHCHVTDAVRGLLCADCNTALGHLRESPERVEALLVYIHERCLW